MRTFISPMKLEHKWAVSCYCIFCKSFFTLVHSTEGTTFGGQSYGKGTGILGSEGGICDKCRGIEHVIEKPKGKMGFSV